MLKQRIKSGELTVGTWLTIGHPAIAEMAARAGYDWVVVDLEHSATAIDTAGELIRIIDLCGVPPLVRLTSNDQNQIKRIMDAGAHGIIVPNVKSPDEASRAVAATRYGPAGCRGVGLARAQGYGSSFAEYLRWQTDSSLVIVQIEDREAVTHLAEILSVPGVDAFIVGPYDLSCSLGRPGDFEHPDYLDAMQRVLAAGRRLAVPAGLHIVEPDLGRLREIIAQGYTFIAYSVDMRILDVGFRLGAQTTKEVQT